MELCGNTKICVKNMFVLVSTHYLHWWFSLMILLMHTLIASWGRQLGCLHLTAAPCGTYCLLITSELSKEQIEDNKNTVHCPVGQL